MYVSVYLSMHVSTYACICICRMVCHRGSSRTAFVQFAMKGCRVTTRPSNRKSSFSNFLVVQWKRLDWTVSAFSFYPNVLAVLNY